MGKKNKSSKALKIAIPIAVVLVLIIISLAVVLGSSTRVAFLNIEEGDVQVDVGNGWVRATDGMKLSEDDKVRTLDGTAVLVLYESVIVQLEEDTEISISELSKDNLRLKQESGSTWNKFAAIAGIKNFEVETPTTVATVRGTEFWVDMESVGVVEGDVDVKMGEKRFNVGKGKKAVLREKIGRLESISPEQIRKAVLQKEKMMNHLKDLRQEEMDKKKGLVTMVKKLYRWNDGDVTTKLDKLDNGGYNEEKIREKSPLPSEAVDKFVGMTREIKKQKQQIEDLKRLGEQKATEPEKTPEDKIPEPEIIEVRRENQPRQPIENIEPGRLRAKE
ncbi:FecR domain-containing protein [Nanoarchaeota archaeon]